MGKRVEKHCNTCRYKDKGMREDPCRKCLRSRVLACHEPMTNGDRIRQMSDEELAEVLACPLGSDDYICEHVSQSCRDCILQWLREVAK